VPGMLSMLANNLNRNVNDVQLFEIGTVFSGDVHRVEERPALALGAVGAVASGPHLPAHAIGFYDLKGALEELLAGFALSSLYFDAFPPDAGLAPSWLDPARSACAVVGGEVIAWFGQLHREQAQRRKLRQAVFAGEIYLDRLYRFPLRQPISGELSRFQSVERDFSFIFPGAVRWSAIADALDGLHLAELIRYAPREVLHKSDDSGTGVPAGHFSILIGVTFQAPERTLRDQELQSYSQSVTRALEGLGGKQRGA
jgi:phenylalanyl-tRNA synthetase beta chain